MENDGNGNFGAARPFACGSFPNRVVLANLDGDDDLDAVTVNNNNSRGVTVLLNNGLAAFTQRRDINVGSATVGIAQPEDYDGDGDLDILGTGAGSVLVWVLRNRGDATFDPVERYAVPGPVEAAVSTDVDGDGDFDAVVVGGSTGGWILENDGTGRFAVAGGFGAGNGPTFVTAGRFNDDDLDDIAVTGVRSNDVSVLLNESGPADTACVIMDSDGDGIPDRVEEAVGLDPNNPDDANSDLDEDGLSNLEEYELGTRIDSSDSDEDGLEDGEEVDLGTDPTNPDSDGDSVSDGEDPFPTFGVVVDVIVPESVMFAETFAVRIELSDHDELLIDDATLQFAVNLPADGRFSSTIEGGTIVEGAESERVIVETGSGFVLLEAVIDVAGRFVIEVEDSDSIGFFSGDLESSLHRINCGSTQTYVDTRGREWRRDSFFSGGSSASFGSVPIDNTEDDVLYQTERWADALGAGASMRYRLSVDPGDYRVDLLFAEVWEGARPPQPPRIFNVDIEGERVLTNFNTVAELGGWRVAGTRSFDVAVSDESVDILFTGGGFAHRNPKISAIEVSSTRPVEPRASILVIGPSPPFRRGDAAADGEVDISDGIRVLAFLFLGGDPPLCFDAADANDDGDIDTSDAIRLFNFLFLGGPPPPAPGPNECGIDETKDSGRVDGDLGCEESLGCL